MIDTPGPIYSFSDVAIEGNGTGTEYGLWTENSTAELTFDAGSISGTAFNPVLVEEPRAATTISDSTIARGTAGGGYFSMKPNPNGTGLDTTASFGPDGAGLTQSVLHDERGPFGAFSQTLTVRPK